MTVFSISSRFVTNYEDGIIFHTKNGSEKQTDQKVEPSSTKPIFNLKLSKSIHD